MLKPKANEKYQEFIDRSMNDADLIKQYPNHADRLDYCVSLWDKHAQKLGEIKKIHEQKEKALKEQKIIYK